MAQLYTHRFAKMIEEFVVQAGLTVYVSDESCDIDLADNLPAIEQIASALKVELVKKVENDVTLLRFRKL